MILDITIVEKVIWSGIAALGFGILFNIPRRVILPVFLLGGIAGFLKFFALTNGSGVVLASLFAASFVGFASIPYARQKQTSPFLLSIPSVIPMIPGYFGYKMLLGITQIAVLGESQNEVETMLSITHNGLNMIFILISLSVGVSLPWLIFKDKALKVIRLKKKGDLV